MSGVMAVAGTTVTLTEKDKITCSLFYNCDTTQLIAELLALQPTTLQFYLILF